MDYNLTEEQIAIRSAVEAIMKDFPDEYWEGKDERHEFPWEFYNAFVSNGFLGVTIPERFGGSGLGLTEAALILGAVSGAGAGLSGCTAVHVGIFGMSPVVKFGSEAMRQKYLPSLVSGDLHVCFGVTEPDAGTDTTKITTPAIVDPIQGVHPTCPDPTTGVSLVVTVM